ncbi:MAG: peptidylprolyl isomerase [Candidatus Pacearchaeota archaeon]|jgi:FKBP-type peptidyl-prolyl cis-trans isomerase 2|nr:peptidylprolyl isomerase [Candidatus Pacearchaeota archaeon]MDP7520724.1 peptidylprolyl isomerase [Candidatus Pacearchaeota archaeon]|tara:strand:- start:1596 stop:2252 length:657 start_codon:yes stop_codon:yes gene_type:complete
MKLQKKDFIEIEFTGRVKGGEIFDSNIKEDLEKVNKEISPKSFIFGLGEEMFIKGVDNFLIGKEVGKKYEIELSPVDAFGNRDSKLVKLMPMKVFREQKINPVAGAMFNFDGRIAKILTVSGGRIIVDFNNPIAGKVVIYKVKVLRKIEDIKEKVKSLIDFLFKRELKFEIKEKKLIIEAEKGMTKFIELFKDKFKSTLGLELDVKEITKKEENKREN